MFALVTIALLALGATPILMMRRLHAVRANIDATIGSAQKTTQDLRLALAREALAYEMVMTTRDSTDVQLYRDRRNEEASLRTRLVPLAIALGDPARSDARALDESVALLHGEMDARLADPHHGGDAARELMRWRGLAADVRDASERLARGLDAMDAANTATAEQSVRREEDVAAMLGILAAMAVALVAWYARRERALIRLLLARAAEESRLGREAERRRLDLVRVSESKGRLTRGFSHDLKNPIGAADGYMQLLEDEVLGPLAEQQLRTIVRARASLRSALKLIEDLLELARAETGEISVVMRPVDARDLVREVAEEFRGQCEGKGLAMVLELDRVPPLSTDPARLRQVLGNLISNATKYTDTGEVRVSLREQKNVTTSDGAPVDGVCVSVKDTGSGIPEAQQKLLFQEFVRLRPDDAPGAGIGLAISRRVVDALGGTISMRSAESGGSVFSVWLPLDRRGTPAFGQSPVNGER